MTNRWLIPLLVVTTMLGACGGEATPSGSPSPTGPAATAEDVQIVRLTLTTGAQLDGNASGLFGDRESLEGGGALPTVARTRIAIATTLQQQAREATAELAPLVPKATVARDAGLAGAEAFVRLAACGRAARAFYTTAAAGNATNTGLDRAAQVCDSAHAAYQEAREAAQAVPTTSATSTAPPASGGVATVTISNVPADDPQPAEIANSVIPGEELTLVYDVQDTGTSPANLRRDCDGPLTFDVSMVVAGTPPAVDVTQAGYSADGSKSGVRAQIVAKNRVVLPLGTFTVTEDAAPRTQVQVFLSNARCPDPQTGASYSPTFGVGVSDKLVLTRS